MTEPTAAATKAASKAVQQTTASADKLNQIADVVEVAELAIEVPAKVVLSNKLVVTVGVVIGAAAGVGGTFLYKKLMERRQIKKELAELGELEKANATPNA